MCGLDDVDWGLWTGLGWTGWTGFRGTCIQAYINNQKLLSMIKRMKRNVGDYGLWSQENVP